jgi:hypothetical protein
MISRRFFLAAFAAVSIAATGFAPASARTAGPPLDVPVARLRAAVHCTPFKNPRRDPVLLVHGTGLDAEQSWGWNYARVLPTLGWDTCTVTLPDHAMNDIQVSSEYVVWAVRTIAARSHRKVSIIGHSQGGLEPRWALRWWPDVRADVGHYIGLASPNHGIVAADACIASGNCWPAVWQFAHGAQFLQALNRGGESPGPTQYTAIYSATDELVQPAIGAATAALAPAPNASSIEIQAICPGRPVNHISLMDDGVVFEIVRRVLMSSHPVSAGQIPLTACATTTMPGLTPADAAVGNATTYAAAAQGFASQPGVHAEPTLAGYAR